MNLLNTFFKLNYTDINTNENRKLPNWLNRRIEENKLYLWGTP